MTIFGRIVAPPNVLHAITIRLRVWLPTFLRELEAQNGMAEGDLRRPPVDAVYGGADLRAWQGDSLPAYIVTVEREGDPTRTGDGSYGQVYRVGIGVVMRMVTEDESLDMAGWHGAAAMGVMLQAREPDDSIITSIDMAQAPGVELADPDDHLTHICTAAYHVFVEPVINDLLGPASATPEDSPAYGGDPEGPWTDWPTVETVTTTVTPVEEIE